MPVLVLLGIFFSFSPCRWQLRPGLPGPAHGHRPTREPGQRLLPEDCGNDGLGMMGSGGRQSAAGDRPGKNSLARIVYPVLAVLAVSLLHVATATGEGYNGNPPNTFTSTATPLSPWPDQGHGDMNPMVIAMSSDKQTLYGVGHSTASGFTASHGTYLHRSIDGGQTWEFRFRFFPMYPQDTVHAGIVLSTNTLLVAQSADLGANSVTNSGMRRSNDGGATFSKLLTIIGGPDGNKFHKAGINSWGFDANEEYVLAAPYGYKDSEGLTHRDAYISTDDGQSFKPVFHLHGDGTYNAKGIHIHGGVIEPAGGAWVFVGDSGGYTGVWHSPGQPAFVAESEAEYTALEATDTGDFTRVYHGLNIKPITAIFSEGINGEKYILVGEDVKSGASITRIRYDDGSYAVETVADFYEQGMRVITGMADLGQGKMVAVSSLDGSPGAQPEIAVSFNQGATWQLDESMKDYLGSYNTCLKTGNASGSVVLSRGQLASPTGPALLYQVLPIPCTAGQPDLALEITDVTWASYADYTAQTLSVDFIVTNTGVDPGHMIQVEGATATNGVHCYDCSAWLGTLPAAAEHLFTLDYIVPEGTIYFTTFVYISAQDGCGDSYNFPGPYPGA